MSRSLCVRAAWLMLLFAAVGTFVAGSAGVAFAQDDPQVSDEGEQGIWGRVEAGGEPLEGVLLRVTRNGSEIGEAVTELDGSWRISVPEAGGGYEIELVTDTLREGFELRERDPNPRTGIRVSHNRDQRVSFNFDDVALPSVSFWDRLANTLWNGLRFGLIIALCSIGLSLVFGTTGLVNFAHAELVTFGALMAWYFNSTSMGPSVTFVLAAIVAVLLSGLAGAGLRLGVWRSLERRRVGLVQLMIVSIGLGLFARYGFGVVFGTSPRTYSDFVAQSPWSWGPLVFPPKDLVIIPLCVAVLVLVAVALQRTRLGTSIRAVSDNRDLAESSGINVQRTVLTVWVLASALAGLGGLVFGLTQSVQWDMGFHLLLIIFAAVILGGIGSVYGPMIGGLVVGMAGELSTLWISAEFRVAFALGALILVLLVRPQGILGLKERIG